MTDIAQDEVLEDLQLGGYRILQKARGFRYGMDAVLLADFVRAGTLDRVVDFGTGTGILPLLLMGRGKGRVFDAFEIQEAMADMAGRTMRLNGVQDRVAVHAADIASAHEIVGYGRADHVVCNPPYGLPGSAFRNPDASLALSRHQGAEGIRPWLQAAFRVLRGRGRLSVIYPAQRMLGLMNMMQEERLTPKRLRMVYPRPDRGANLVLVEAQKEAKPLLHLEPPLIVHDTDGSETEEIRRIYHMA